MDVDTTPVPRRGRPSSSAPSSSASTGERFTARTFCVTVNNRDEVEQNWPNAIQEPSEEFVERVRYVVWQRELAPETGRVHIQAYVELYMAAGIAMLKRLFNCPTMHVEKRRGTQDQARNYCMKEDTRDGPDGGPFEYGTYSKTPGNGQGKRNDLTDAVEALAAGGVEAVVEKHPNTYVRYHRGIHALYQAKLEAIASRQQRNVKTAVFYGEPGTGKTHCAFELARITGEEIYILNAPAGRNQSVWFNGYQNQKILVVDEMNGDWIGWQLLLRMTDKYPLQCQTKGGMVWAMWEIVIFTSNAHWEDWYPYYAGGMDKAALKRRIHKVVKFYGSEAAGNFTKKYYDPDLPEANWTVATTDVIATFLKNGTVRPHTDEEREEAEDVVMNTQQESQGTQTTELVEDSDDEMSETF